jgi:hypothetical protein
MLRWQLVNIQPNVKKSCCKCVRSKSVPNVAHIIAGDPVGKVATDIAEKPNAK